MVITVPMFGYHFNEDARVKINPELYGKNLYNYIVILYSYII